MQGEVGQSLDLPSVSVKPEEKKLFWMEVVGLRLLLAQDGLKERV